MKMRSSHKDVEFAVDDASGKERTFKKWDDAAGFATSVATATGRKVNLDVLVFSRAGANWVSGDEGVEEYDEDPDASVFQRFEISVNFVGRVA